jgi:hypothetical protein
MFDTRAFWDLRGPLESRNTASFSTIRDGRKADLGI